MKRDGYSCFVLLQREIIITKPPLHPHRAIFRLLEVCYLFCSFSQLFFRIQK